MVLINQQALAAEGVTDLPVFDQLAKKSRSITANP